MSSSSTSTDKLHQIMEAATRAGADAVEVIMATTSEIGASVRLGGVDEIEKNDHFEEFKNFELINFGYKPPLNLIQWSIIAWWVQVPTDLNARILNWSEAT
ncbi:MAG: hypothetical protein AAF208_09630 [Cyanobacteria bacterium P01_A01_bin.45]